MRWRSPLCAREIGSERSRFHDIVAGERIVFSHYLFHDRRLISVLLTRSSSSSTAPAPRLLFTEQGAFFDDPEAGAAREHGTGELLDALARFLAAEPVR